MREVLLSWSPESLASSDFGPVTKICSSLEVLAHLDVSEKGVRQLAKIKLLPEHDVTELNELPFFSIEGPLPPLDLPEVGGEGFIVLWNHHALSVAAIRFEDIAVIPPYKFGSDGMLITVRGVPSGVSKFVKIAKMLLPPDKISVLIGDDSSGGIDEVLTEKQLHAIRSAHKYGYYEFPREMSLRELSELIDMPRSTLGDLLSRAEVNLIDWAMQFDES